MELKRTYGTFGKVTDIARKENERNNFAKCGSDTEACNAEVCNGEVCNGEAVAEQSEEHVESSASEEHVASSGSEESEELGRESEELGRGERNDIGNNVGKEEGEEAGNGEAMEECEELPGGEGEDEGKEECDRHGRVIVSEEHGSPIVSEEHGSPIAADRCGRAVINPTAGEKSPTSCENSPVLITIHLCNENGTESANKGPPQCFCVTCKE